MNAPELLRAGGWRQGHGDNGQPYWEHVVRYGLTRWDPAAALGDELARVSAERDFLQTHLDRALELLREAAPALLEGAKELRKVVDRARAQPAAPTPWRVGARVLEHIYDGAGKPLVTMPSADLAALVVASVNERPAAPEPHWLTKDFNALYRAARELLRAIDGHWLDGRAEAARIRLSGQLTRLQPAFDETEAARAELAGRAP